MSSVRDPVLLAAAEHIQQGRLDAAEEILASRGSESSPSQVAKQLATIALKRGEIDRAKEIVSRVLAANDADPEAYALLGAAHLAMGERDAALACAERAHQLAPDPRRTMNLALAELAAGRGFSAVERLEALKAADPAWGELVYNLGTAYLEIGRPDLAQAELTRATELEPTHMEGWANLANAAQLRGRTDEALAAIERALLIDPLKPVLLASRAAILYDARREDEAIAAAERAAALQPGAVYPLAIKGAALLRKGDYGAASAALAQAIRLDPEHVMATTAIAAALRRQGKLPESLLTLERLEHLRKGDPVVRRARVETLLALGRFEEVFSLWDERKDSRSPATIEGLERILLLADPDPSTTVALLRYVQRVAELGVTVLMAAEEAQLGIARAAVGVTEVLGPADDVPEGTAVLPLRRLPRLLGPRDWKGPYLRAAEAPAPGARIGICLEMGTDPWGPPDGDAPVEDDVVEALGCDVVRLGSRVPPTTLLSVMASLERVVAVDGLVAHLAGALGRPLVVLLDLGGGWAWPAGHEPWYPAEVLRQSTAGDWAPVLRRLREIAPPCD